MGDHAEVRRVETVSAQVVNPFEPGGESASGSPLLAVPLVGRIVLKPWTAGGAIGHFLGLSGLLKSLLDQLCFCVGDCAKDERYGKGVDEEWLDRHGWLDWMAGGSAPSTPSRSQPYW